MTVTPGDLAWFLNLAQGLRWREAVTYRDTAPHSYITVHDDNGLTRDDYRRAGAVIHTFGEPGSYWGHFNLYLDDPDTNTRFWHMDGDWRACDLINKTPRERLYGPQRSPRTFSAGFTYWDSIATVYDEMPRLEARDADVLDQVRAHFPPDRSPLVLDLGSGTGWALDQGITVPHRYWAIDSSQAMMNELIRRHQQVRNVLVARAEDVALASLPPRFDLLLAVDASMIPTATIARFANLADVVIIED